MSCCVGQASLGVNLTMCVVCYAAGWHADKVTLLSALCNDKKK